MKPEVHENWNTAEGYYRKAWVANLNGDHGQVVINSILAVRSGYRAIQNCEICDTQASSIAVNYMSSGELQKMPAKDILEKAKNILNKMRSTLPDEYHLPEIRNPI